MIQETEIVQDTRRIRSDISERFGNDFNRYIDFLQTRKSENPSRKASEYHELEIKDAKQAPPVDLR